MAERLYFAYGSNINLEQMAVRCPAAQVVGPAVLDGYELLFRGNRRGTGVATIEPLPDSQVHGLLWMLTPECEDPWTSMRDTRACMRKRISRSAPGTAKTWSSWPTS